VTHDLEEAIALADESSSFLPAGSARRRVPPGDARSSSHLMELRTSPAFVDLYGAIWWCSAKK